MSMSTKTVTPFTVLPGKRKRRTDEERVMDRLCAKVRRLDPHFAQLIESCVDHMLADG